MKKIIKTTTAMLCSLVICATSLTGCGGEEAYEKELYRPIVYLLSSGNENVYSTVIPFKETDATAYFSIGCGGSLPNSEEFTVELEPDTLLFDNYNRINHVVDTASFANLLADDRYEIESYTVKFPAHSPEQYVKIPIKVNHQGLSPDSTYFIPLAIKSVSKYEVNPDKMNVLIRVAVENDYAEQLTQTIYYQRGTLVSGGKSTSINTSKVLYPLSKDEVRLLAGNYIATDKNKGITLEEINKYSIVARIGADNSVVISSYATIEVEQLEQENYNRFYTQKNAEGKDIQYIDLCYRYRPEGVTDWIEIKESLQRMN